MKSFEDSLNELGLNYYSRADLTFEAYLLKHTDYNLITTDYDLKNIVSYDPELPRFAVLTANVNETSTFLGIPYHRIIGKMHTICFKIVHEDRSDRSNTLKLNVFGAKQMEYLKPKIASFLEVNNDITIDLTLDAAEDALWKYPEIEDISFWQIIKNLFIKYDYTIGEYERRKN